MKRPVVTLLTLSVFLVISVTGVLAFIRPFSLQIVGLHALMGFLFVGVIGFHIVNNIKPLKGHLRRKQIVGITIGSVAISLSGRLKSDPRTNRFH